MCIVASAGQLKLRSAKVLLVGAGGLGCPAAEYLAGAGVGTLGLVDGDAVEISNLHRQVLHRGRNVGKYKVDSAIESLREWVMILGAVIKETRVDIILFSHTD